MSVIERPSIEYKQFHGKPLSYWKNKRVYVLKDLYGFSGTKLASEGDTATITGRDKRGLGFDLRTNEGKAIYCVFYQYLSIIK